MEISFIHTQMWFIYMWIKLVSKLEALNLRTHFETEAKGNSEIAYYFSQAENIKSKNL